MKQLTKQTKSTVRSQNNVNKACCRSLIGSNPQGWKGSGQSCVSSWRQGSEGRAGLEMSLEQQRKREALRPHSEPAAQPCCSLSSCPCQSCQKRGTHTSKRGWHPGANRWNWSLAKVGGQELHSALRGLSPTHCNHSVPGMKQLETCSDCPGGMDQVERALAGNTQPEIPIQARFRQITDSYSFVLHLEQAATTQLCWVLVGLGNFQGWEGNLWLKRLWCLLKTSERLEPGQALRRIQTLFPGVFINREGKGKHRLTNMSVTVSGPGFAGKAL